MNITNIEGRVRLLNGVKMPYLGLGVYKAKGGEEVIRSIHHAIDAGYRLIDTASFYNNEAGVGKAIRTANIDREELFVTTKLWIDDQETGLTREAFEKSMERLGLDYLDLYLIHWPVPGKYLESWKVLQDLYEEGRVKAIGVSNCLEHHLESIRELGGVQPMVLQNEFHPKLIQKGIMEYCKNHGIQYQAWSPLMRGRILQDEVIRSLGEKYQKSTAQIILRWDLQKGVATIPKSVHESRIRENSAIFDFKLTREEVRIIDALEDNTRTGAHPDNFMTHFQGSE